MTCYVLTLLLERFNSSDKDIDVEINGETKKLYWYHSIKYYNGWLIYEHEPNVKYPAYGIRVCNMYRSSLPALLKGSGNSVFIRGWNRT